MPEIVSPRTFRNQAGWVMMPRQLDHLRHRIRRPPAMAESLIITPGTSRRDRYAEMNRHPQAVGFAR